MKNIALFGEMLVDLISNKQTTNSINFTATPGGSIFNTAITLQRMGINTKFYSKVGNDFWGNYLKEFLLDNNMDTRGIYTCLNEKTPLAFAFLDNLKNAHYDFYKSTEKEQIKIKEFSQIDNTSFFHFGSFFSILKENRPIINKFFRFAKKNNFIISYDPNFRRKFSQSSIKNIFINMHHSHIIKCSMEDMENIFSKVTVQEAFECLDKFNPILSIITLGEKGAAAKTQNSSIVLIPPNESQTIISTIGAGDNFSSAYLFFLFKKGLDTITQIKNMNEKTIKEMLRFSTKLASLSLATRGAIIDAQSLQEFIKNKFEV